MLVTRREESFSAGEQCLTGTAHGACRVQQTRPRRRLHVGDRFCISGEMRGRTTLVPSVRVIGDDHDGQITALNGAGWLAAKYPTKAYYTVTGRDDEAGVLLATSEDRPEFALISIAVAETDCSPCGGCGSRSGCDTGERCRYISRAWTRDDLPWSAVLTRALIETVEEEERCRYRHLHISHEDLIGRRLNQECDMSVVPFGETDTFEESWQECVATARENHDAFVMRRFYATRAEPSTLAD